MKDNLLLDLLVDDLKVSGAFNIIKKLSELNRLDCIYESQNIKFLNMIIDDMNYLYDEIRPHLFLKNYRSILLYEKEFDNDNNKIITNNVYKIMSKKSRFHDLDKLIILINPNYLTYENLDLLDIFIPRFVRIIDSKFKSNSSLNKYFVKVLKDNEYFDVGVYLYILCKYNKYSKYDLSKSINNLIKSAMNKRNYNKLDFHKKPFILLYKEFNYISKLICDNLIDYTLNLDISILESFIYNKIVKFKEKVDWKFYLISMYDHLNIYHDQIDRKKLIMNTILKMGG